MREAAGISLLNMAAAVGMRDSYNYFRLEREDCMPGVDTVLRIATVLNCKVEDLIQEVTDVR